MVGTADMLCTADLLVCRMQSVCTAEYHGVAGLGTLVGDAVEMGAVMETIGGTARRDQPLLAGSYKPNIGHTYTGIQPTQYSTQ